MNLPYKIYQKLLKLERISNLNKDNKVWVYSEIIDCMGWSSYGDWGKWDRIK